MRRRFFVDQVRNGHAEISGDDARHLTRVLRVEAGQIYEISDDQNVYVAEVETARKEHVVFKTREKLPLVQPPVQITLAAALIKFDHFEWMIEKATELGVARIVPIVAIRSEKGLAQAAVKRSERWRRIGLEAAQQSRRTYLPEISEPVAFDKVLALQGAYRYVFDEDPTAPPLFTLLPATRRDTDGVVLLIGPEGGWTDPERSAFTAANWTRASLGPTILRAETAAIAALAVINAAWCG